MAEKIMTIGDICHKALQVLEGYELPYELPYVPQAGGRQPDLLYAGLDFCRALEDFSDALITYTLEEPEVVREALRQWLGSEGESKSEGE